jgi:hypothetical protein
MYPSGRRFSDVLHVFSPLLRYFYKIELRNFISIYFILLLMLFRISNALEVLKLNIERECGNSGWSEEIN